MSSKHRAAVLWTTDQTKTKTSMVWTHSLAPWATETSAALTWCDLCPHNAVVGGILKGEINNVSAVTPGSAFHFQISSIAAAARSSSVLNITFSSVCDVSFLYSSGWSIAPALFIHLTKDTFKLTVFGSPITSISWRSLQQRTGPNSFMTKFWDKTNEKKENEFQPNEIWN